MARRIRRAELTRPTRAHSSTTTARALPELRQVTEQSGGNPFWALQSAATLQSHDTSVPQLARSLSRRLAAALSADAAAALAVVAAAGRIDVPQTLDALHGRVADPIAALDAAVVAGVLLESEGRVTGDTLTATEQRVAELIGSGASNRGAADALFISVRTVETHVAAIYRKLGVRSRAELAKWLADTSAD
jgi:DNA-binding CsgD family transcriptional regulator